MTTYKFAFNWRGAWASTPTRYSKDDLVSSGGSVWKAKVANAGQTPAAGAYWEIFVERGAQGQGGQTLYASAAALSAVTGQVDGQTAFVKDLGAFRFDAASTTTANGTHVIAPGVGTGRWLATAAGKALLPYLNVRDYGATGDGTTDDYAAVAAALTAAASLTSSSATVFFPAGTYKISQGLVIPKGVHLRGDSGYGQGTWTQLKFTGSGNFITFNGADSVGGGRIENLLITRDGQSGGDAIKLIATSGTARPGEILIQNVLVSSFDGTYTWGRGLHIDGTAANTVGSKGVRNVRLDKFRVADVSTVGESIYINQGTHIVGTHIQVDTGIGSAPGIKTAGETVNLMLIGVICNGDMALAGNLRNAKIVGLVGGDLNIAATCVAVDCLVNGATLTIASGASGTAQGHWTGSVTESSTTFVVTNAARHQLYLPAQTADAGTAPIKLRQGTVMTTPENGAFEFDASGILYFTGSGTTRDRVFTGRTGTASLNFASSIANGAADSLTLTVTGAANGQAVVLAAPPGMTAGLIAFGKVTAANTVTVTIANLSGGAVTPGALTFTAIVLR
jgi:hypothetical protein